MPARRPALSERGVPLRRLPVCMPGTRQILAGLALLGCGALAVVVLDRPDASSPSPSPPAAPAPGVTEEPRQPDDREPEPDRSSQWRAETRARFHDAERLCGVTGLQILCEGSACGILVPEPTATSLLMRYVRRPRILLEEVLDAAGAPMAETCATAAAAFEGSGQLTFPLPYASGCRAYVAAADPGAVEAARDLCLRLGATASPR